MTNVEELLLFLCRSYWILFLLYSFERIKRCCCPHKRFLVLQKIMFRTRKLVPTYSLVCSKREFKALLIHLSRWTWKSSLLEVSCLHSTLTCLSLCQWNLQNLYLVLSRKASSYTLDFKQHGFKWVIPWSSTQDTFYLLNRYSTSYTACGEALTLNLRCWEFRK